MGWPPPPREEDPEPTFSYKRSPEVSSLERRCIMEPESPVEVLLRGHLLIEHFLNELINERFRYPEKADLDRFTFAEKLRICEAQGSVDPGQRSEIGRINQLRNRLAHEISMDVSEKVEEEILAAISEPTRLGYDMLVKFTEDDGKDAVFPVPMKLALVTIVLRLDMTLQHLRWQRTNDRELLEWSAREAARNIVEVNRAKREAQRREAGHPVTP
jgi:hypothetical protein